MKAYQNISAHNNVLDTNIPLPHVYRVAHECYTTMASESARQSIILVGESVRLT